MILMLSLTANMIETTKGKFHEARPKRKFYGRG